MIVQVIISERVVLGHESPAKSIVGLLANAFIMPKNTASMLCSIA
jgi:hypothetical protein